MSSLNPVPRQPLQSSVPSTEAFRAPDKSTSPQVLKMGLSGLAQEEFERHLCALRNDLSELMRQNPERYLNALDTNVVERKKIIDHYSDHFRTILSSYSPHAATLLSTIVMGSQFARQERLNAAWALRLLAVDSPSVVSDLISTFTNKEEPEARSFSAKALGMIGAAAAPAIPNLMQAFRDRDASVRESVTEALGQIGRTCDQVVPLLIKELHAWNPSVRCLAAKALGKIGAAAAPAVAPLIKATRAWNFQVRENAIEALGKIGPVSDEIVPALKQTIRNEHHLITSIKALGFMGKAAVPVLIGHLAHKKANVSRHVIQALGMIGDPAVPTLIAMLGEENDLGQNQVQDPTQLPLARSYRQHLIRYEAAHALVRVGLVCVPDLYVALGSKDASTRQWASSLIAAFAKSENSITSFLVSILADDTNPFARAAAAETLGKIRPPSFSAKETLFQALDDKDEQVRGAAVKALGNLRSSPAHFDLSSLSALQGAEFVL